MDTTSRNIAKEYNKCCAIGCVRLGRTVLKVRYLNKTGLFCNCCANDLVAGDLAVEAGADSNE